MALSIDEDLSTPALLRAARGAYAQAMRAALADVGVDDLPKNGAFILAGIDASGGPRTELPQELGVTPKALRTAIEALVARGSSTAAPTRATAPSCSSRQPEADGRGRGQVRHRAVDGELRDNVTSERIEASQAGLLALAQIKGARRRRVAAGAGLALRSGAASPCSRCETCSGPPASYRALGFTVIPDEEGDAHAFARREAAGLHLVTDDHHAGTGVAYLHVRDADALDAEWQSADADGELRPVEATRYGMREGAFIDPDGNALHFGSNADE